MGAKASRPGPTFFRTPADFRRWLHRYHATSDVLWVGYYKKATGQPSITWEDSRDQALCFGWIDGIRRSVNEKSFMVRFTPRRPGSRWSAVNIARVKELTKLGLMRQAGLDAFRKRSTKKPVTSRSDIHNAALSRDQERRLRAHTKAWEFLRSQPPSYRNMAVFWVNDAKKEETRERRFQTLVRDSDNQERIGPLRRRPPAGKRS